MSSQATALYSLGDVADLIREGVAFRGMPRAEALRIAEILTMREFKSGEAISREGEPTEGYLAVVVSGEVAVTYGEPSTPHHVVLRNARPGNWLGEVGFIDGAPHSATCTAIGLVHMAGLHRGEFTVLLADHPTLAAQLMAGLMRSMASRIRRCNATIAELRAGRSG